MTADKSRRLVLLRHAKSAWPLDIADHERPLAPRGRRAAPAAGQWLQAAGCEPDRVVCSTARRARQTWGLAAAELARPPAAQFDERVYAAPASDLLAVIRDTGGQAGTLLIVGHNPGLQDLALALARPGAGDAAALARARAKFPTGAIAVLELTGAWPDLRLRQARLTSFVTPKDLRAADAG
ncbi:MAG: SixA phosphatase family protein [Streptosporangiaceae bacterium]